MGCCYISTQDKYVGFNVLNVFVRKEVFRFNWVKYSFQDVVLKKRNKAERNYKDTDRNKKYRKYTHMHTHNREDQ